MRLCRDMSSDTASCECVHQLDPWLREMGVTKCTLKNTSLDDLYGLLMSAVSSLIIRYSEDGTFTLVQLSS